MSSYGSELVCDRLRINDGGVFTNYGWLNADFGDYEIAAGATTLTLNQTSSYFILNVAAATTPGPNRVITITFPSPIIAEAINPNLTVLSVAPGAEVASTNLYVAQFQKLSNTSFSLIIEHNGGATNITEEVRVIGAIMFNSTV